MLPYILMALVAALLGLSVWSTWRSRKKDDERARRLEEKKRNERYGAGLPEDPALWKRPEEPDEK